jgi:hypothetical protein
LRADRGAFGADQGRLGADQCGVGSLAGGAGALARFATDRARIRWRWLLGCWEVEHRSCFVERDLLDVSAFLGMIVSLLADVPGDLLAIDPGLAIAEDALLLVVGACAALALVILADLLLIDADLLAVADELLPVTEGLLEVGQALFLSEL